ncbi:MAG: hypothetical protein AB8I08_19410 [Sandaracinaceae bacterium]
MVVPPHSRRATWQRVELLRHLRAPTVDEAKMESEWVLPRTAAASIGLFVTIEKPFPPASREAVAVYQDAFGRMDLPMMYVWVPGGGFGGSLIRSLMTGITHLSGNATRVKVTGQLSSAVDALATAFGDGEPGRGLYDAVESLRLDSMEQLTG